MERLPGQVGVLQASGFGGFAVSFDLMLMTAISTEWVAQLRCPRSGSRLFAVGGREWVQWVGASRGSGSEAGETEMAGLVCADGSGVYPVRGGIPVLLEEEWVELTGRGREEAGRWLRERGFFCGETPQH
jgi:uncharacterized protein YbaR (Trm112 family)